MGHRISSTLLCRVATDHHYASVDACIFTNSKGLGTGWALSRRPPRVSAQDGSSCTNSVDRIQRITEFATELWRSASLPPELLKRNETQNSGRRRLQIEAPLAQSKHLRAVDFELLYIIIFKNVLIVAVMRLLRRESVLNSHTPPIR